MGLLSFLFGISSSKQLAEAVKSDCYLVDVRSRSEFATGSVKGAINIPVENIPTQAEKLKDKKPVILFCRSGARSGHAKGILEKKGFEQVINGGSWKAVKKAVEK